VCVMRANGDSLANRLAGSNRVQPAGGYEGAPGNGALVVVQVAWVKQQGKTAVMEAALAKLYLSECFVQSSLDAIRIHGGYGYMTEFEVDVI